MSCVGATVLMSSVVWLRLLTKNTRTVYFFLILLISYLAALIIQHYDQKSSMYDEAYDITSRIAVELCSPLFLFYSSMGTDFSELSVNAGVTITSMLAFSILVASISAFASWPFLHFCANIDFTTSFLIMLILTPKWAASAVLELDGVQGHIRDTQMMLKFEQLCSTWLAYVLTEMVFKWQLLQSWPHFRMIRYIAAIMYKSLGLIIGAIFGLIIRIPFSFAYNDITAQAIIILSSIYMVQLLSTILGTSPGLAIGIYGVSLNSNKVKMSKDAEEFHGEMWEWYIFMAETVTGILAGMILGLKRPGVIGLLHYGMIVLIYCMILAIRVIIIVLSRVCVAEQNDLYWKRVVIMGIAPYHGFVCVLLAMKYMSYDELHGYQNITYIIGIVALSVFFNSMLFKSMLNILGMFEYKRATIVNMNVAVGQINTCRDKAIFSQKMDLVIADANWAIVENLTRLPHPYRRKLMETGYSEDKGDFRLRTIICSSCGIEVVAPPTKGEIEDMIVEAKQRVLKIQLVSFGQQYENGTISRHSYRTLFSVIDSAASSGTPVIDSTPLNIRTQESKTTRFFRKVFTYLTAVTSRTYVYVPENLFRVLAYRLTTSRGFNIILAFLALTDTGLIARLIMVWLLVEQDEAGTDDFSDQDLEYGRVVQMFDVIFFLIFALEFVIQLTGLGMIQYFSSHLNKVEMGTNLVRTAELIMYFTTATSYGVFISVLLVEDIVLWMKCLLLVRIVRVYVFVVGWLPRCLGMVEKQVEEELMRNYEVGKGYLVSLERVMKFLSHVAIYETVYDAIKAEIETERRKVAKDLGLIQKEHPSIAITVKTRHAIRFVINSVADCMNDLKEDGILDLNESKAMNQSLEKVKNDLRELPMVDPSMAQSVLKDITWLNQDEIHSELLMNSAKLTSYDYNDRIISVGDDPVGLYVLVSGLVKAYYNPTPITVQLNSKFGVLPNYDFFDIIRFDQAQDSYVVAGNVIGEIGAVSGRRYDMSVICETSVQLYFIPWTVLKTIIHESDDAMEIQNSIWKCIGVRLGVVLTHSKAPFSDWPKEKLMAHLESGWVPSLQQIKCLNITDDVADIILIEGVCKDSMSGTVYFGPAYLPKGMKLIMLPDHPSWDFQTVYSTKMLIVPSTQNTDNLITDLFKEHHNINRRNEAAASLKDTKRVEFGAEDQSILSSTSISASSNPSTQ
ncbi:hypothetical protein GE061_011821 [Apolygus lucorum]|uniref:Uncharacterized protein n=1 Tax=Apolygus lucorum TaxID=248454 RepID=A0A6A4K7E8_APOLU|nr:hypothetical protein GE061_011821 [Apolygus lucorum]